MYDCLTGVNLATIKYPSSINKICIDGLETLIVAGSKIGEIYLSILEGPSATSTPYTFKGHTACISSLSISHQGPYLISGDTSGVIFVWDMVNKLKIRSFNYPCTNLAFLTLTLKSPFLFTLPPEDYNLPLIRPFQWRVVPDEEKHNILCYNTNAVPLKVAEITPTSSPQNGDLIKLTNTYNSLIGSFFDTINASTNI